MILACRLKVSLVSLDSLTEFREHSLLLWVVCRSWIQWTHLYISIPVESESTGNLQGNVLVLSKIVGQKLFNNDALVISTGLGS